MGIRGVARPSDAKADPPILRFSRISSPSQRTYGAVGTLLRGVDGLSMVVGQVNGR